MKTEVVETSRTTTTTSSVTGRYASLPGRYQNGNYAGEVNGNLNNIVRTATLPATNRHGLDKFEIPLPFGFHMDLDFLRFCNEDPVTSETLERLKELRKARRKQRKQLEAFMGFQREQRDRIHQHIYSITKSKSNSPEKDDAANNRMRSTTLTFQHTPSRTSPIALDLTHHHTSEFIKEALKEAVLDFEQCLQGTANSTTTSSMIHKSKFNTFPRLSAASGDEPAVHSELRDRIEKLYHQSNSSISSISTSSSALPYGSPLSPDAVLAGLPSSVAPRSSNDHMETDSIVSISSDMSTTTLRNIREQMAKSLTKLKEYEKQVEAIPVLQVKLSVLKEEKRLLMLQLKQREFQLRKETSRGGGDDSDVPLDLDLMEDTEDDEEHDHRMITSKLKQPHRFYLDKPRARSESPFAKGGRVRPEEFISVRRQRSTSCGYNSDGSDSNLEQQHQQQGGRRFYESRVTSRTKGNLSQERSEISFYTEGGGGGVGGRKQASAARPAAVDCRDAAINTDPLPVEVTDAKVQPERQSPARPISRRDRAINTDPAVKVRTANHGTSTVKISTLAKGTSTSMVMSDLVTKDEMDAKIQEAIFKTEEEIMGCPLLQKAMAKVEEEAINGPAPAASSETAKVPKCDVQCQVGDENLRPFVITVGLQCKLEEQPVVCATCQMREQEEANATSTADRFLAAVGASPVPAATVTTRTIGVGDCKLIEDPPDPTAFRHIGVCTEKWVEVIKASKQTDTEDFAYKDTESPRVADMVFEPSPERVVLQRRSSLRKSTTSSPSVSRRSSTNSPLTTRKASTTQTKAAQTKHQGTNTDAEVKIKVPTRDAKTGGQAVETKTASTSAMVLPLVSKNLPAQGSPLTTPETEHPTTKLNLCDKCNRDIKQVAEGIVAGPSPSPKIHAPPSPDLPWLSKIPRPVPENPTVHKLKSATSTGNLLSVGSRPKSPAGMQRSKSTLTPTMGRKVLSPNFSGSPRRDLGTPPPHPSTPPLGSRRVSSPLARSQSPYGAEKKSLIPKLSNSGGSSNIPTTGVKRGTTVSGPSATSTGGTLTPNSAETRSLIPRVQTPPALRKMYPKDGSDKLATPDRNVVRKNTYTKDMAGVANPALESSSSGKPTSLSDIKEDPKKDDKVKKDGEEDAADGNKTDEEVSAEKKSNFPLPGAALFAPIDENRNKATPSKEMRAALKVLHDSLARKSSNPVQSTNAVNIVQQEWFKISSTKGSNPLNVEDYLDFIELEMSKELLGRIVNLTDVNGNTALHYSVSHGNFDVVSVLLDSKVTNPNILNKAGYTCIMLISLAQIINDTHRAVVRRLFSTGDVNIRASQHGQTALMLAVSHGRLDMVQLLVEAGADLNIRDEDGSTALMCAAEHGQTDIVKHLLTHPDTDIFAKDNDGLTALAVAMEAGHRDLGVVLYANMSMSRGASPYSSMRLRPTASGGSRTSTPTGSMKSKGATPPRSPIAPTPPHRSRRTSSNQ